jgi:ABC-2 type transport system ATP-binding protein
MEGDTYVLALAELTQIEFVLAELRDAQVPVEDLQLTEADLEDVFVELVGR